MGIGEGMKERREGEKERKVKNREQGEQSVRRR